MEKNYAKEFIQQFIFEAFFKEIVLSWFRLFRNFDKQKALNLMLGNFNFKKSIIDLKFQQIFQETFIF